MAEIIEFKSGYRKILENALKDIQTGTVKGVVVAVLKENKEVGYGIDVDLNKIDEMLKLLLVIFSTILDRRGSQAHERPNAS